MRSVWWPSPTSYYVGPQDKKRAHYKSSNLYYLYLKLIYRPVHDLVMSQNNKTYYILQYTVVLDYKYYTINTTEDD